MRWSEGRLRINSVWQLLGAHLEFGKYLANSYTTNFSQFYRKNWEKKLKILTLSFLSPKETTALLHPERDQVLLNGLGVSCSVFKPLTGHKP